MKTHIIYEGPSLYNGKPIVVLVQSGSRNSKTGDMVQTFILDATKDPLEASRSGSDKSVCGNCPHMGTPNDNTKGGATKRSCYVTLAHAPLGKYKAFKRGMYPTVSGHKAIAELGRDQTVRLGTFGDPAAVPQYIWDSLISDAAGHTAYTHGSINPSPSTIMTSADTKEAAFKAWSKDERTFRVIADVSDVLKGKEILCPASEEAGRKATCKTCKLCSGAGIKAKSIAIVAHGTSKRYAKERAVL
jgi:hypothetical protein